MLQQENEELWSRVRQARMHQVHLAPEIPMSLPGAVFGVHRCWQERENPGDTQASEPPQEALDVKSLSSGRKTDL